MNKNEYRRALIMLRSRANGYAGHVRLERRVMMGRLDFIVTAPQGDERLEAALAGQRNGDYYAARLGALRRDRRGQAALSWTFDPRSIEGRPLEAYSLAVVARVGPEGCAIALSGNVEGARPLDMAQVEDAVCARLRADEEPAGDLPEAGEETAGEGEGDAEMAIAEQRRTEPADTGLTPEQAAAETRIFTRSRPPRGRADAAQAASETGRADGAAGEDPAPAEAPDAAGGPARRTAAEALGIDTASPWTGALEPLRALFAAEEPVATLEDDFVYVRAPLGAAGSGGACGWTTDSCRVGLHLSGGRVDAVRYAVPALYTPEPPEGLEAYAWAGDNTHGYWVMTADPQTGRPM